MNDIKELLDERIKKEIEGLSSLEIASQEKGAAIQDLVNLYKLRIEESKNEMDAKEKHDACIMELDEKKALRFMEHEQEMLSKKALLEEQTKDRYVKIGIASAEIGLPLAFYAVWMKRGFKFEETGTFTSTVFKGLFSRFKPTKK